MRRLIAVLVSSLTAIILAGAPASAHPLTPPGNPSGGPGGLPIGDHPGHNGVQCAHEAGAPTFQTDLSEVFTCPAAN